MFVRATVIAAGTAVVAVGIRYGKNIMRSKEAAKVLTKLNSLTKVTVGGDGGAIWQNFITAPNTPAGFTLKEAYNPATNTTGATTILEQWKAGSSEPPHSHPGDDMTILIEGRMKIQFFNKDASGSLTADGSPIELTAGQTGYVPAHRIHDAKYEEDCKIVYVHHQAFGFVDHTPKSLS